MIATERFQHLPVREKPLLERLGHGKTRRKRDIPNATEVQAQQGVLVLCTKVVVHKPGGSGTRGDLKHGQYERTCCLLGWSSRVYASFLNSMQEQLKERLFSGCGLHLRAQMFFPGCPELDTR